MSNAERGVILNASTGRYVRGLRRLQESVEKFSDTMIDFKGWADVMPPGSPTHQEHPYAFKQYAFQWAIDQGYRYALWADSSVWFVKPPSIMFGQIKLNGHIIATGGWDVYTWSTDDCLAKCGITREQSRGMTMIAATCYGLDLLKRREVHDWMMARAKDGSMRGPWKYEPHEAPAEGVKGHRHDQTCLSIITDRLGLSVDRPPCWFAYAVRSDKARAETARAPQPDVNVVICEGV